MPLHFGEQLASENKNTEPGQIKQPFFLFFLREGEQLLWVFLVTGNGPFKVM